MLTMRVSPPKLSLANASKTLASNSSGGVVYDNLFDYNNGEYSHTNSVTIGYDTMSISIMVPDYDIRDWISRGIGRHIEVYAPSGRVWEGFVNEISVSIAGTTLRIGPLLELANKIKVTYTTRRWNTNPPIGGDAAETAFNTDTDSQARWGTFERVISGGEGVEATMTALRDSKLNEFAWPTVSQDFNPGSSGDGSISLSCLGYYHYLSRFLFDDNTADTGTVAISAKMADVLDADPDTLFSSTNSTIETNSLQTPSYDDGSRTAMDVVQELIGLGYPSGERTYFKVGNDRHVKMGAIPVDNDPKYVYSIYDQYPSLSRKDGVVVMPWDIVTGEWIEISSLSGRPFSSSLPRHSDPRYIFIESVTYSAPDGISISGGFGSTIKEKMSSRYGISFADGIGGGDSPRYRMSYNLRRMHASK